MKVIISPRFYVVISPRFYVAISLEVEGEMATEFKLSLRYSTSLVFAQKQRLDYIHA